ncbi:hypothetical protein C8R43DRAFT_952413 [Mycena crocata]|nr:hypothetical protein C8R43DRAFT_952413 [Mycena crocata]
MTRERSNRWQAARCLYDAFPAGDGFQADELRTAGSSDALALLLVVVYIVGRIGNGRAGNGHWRRLGVVLASSAHRWGNSARRKAEEACCPARDGAWGPSPVACGFAGLEATQAKSKILRLLGRVRHPRAPGSAWRRRAGGSRLKEHGNCCDPRRRCTGEAPHRILTARYQIKNAGGSSLVQQSTYPTRSETCCCRSSTQPFAVASALRVPSPHPPPASRYPLRTDRHQLRLLVLEIDTWADVGGGSMFGVTERAPNRTSFASGSSARQCSLAPTRAGQNFTWPGERRLELQGQEHDRTCVGSDGRSPMHGGGGRMGGSMSGC